jgi:hypothetical protein
MNAKKILSAAFKTVPDRYVDQYARIFVRGREGDDYSRMVVIIAHPTLPTIVWTRDKGWEEAMETKEEVEESAKETADVKGT